MAKTEVVINRDTAAQYRGRINEPDGTISDIYYVPVKGSSEGVWTSPPPYITLPGKVSSTLRKQPSVMISSIFSEIIADPKDFSVLRLLLCDLERQLDQSLENLMVCWNLWQPLLKTVWKNIGEGPTKELFRIENEIRAALKEGQHQLQDADQQYLKTLITVAYRHTIPAAHRVLDCGPQLNDVAEMENDVVEAAEAEATHAILWTTGVLISIIDCQREFSDRASKTMSGYTDGIESGEELKEKLQVWLNGLYGKVRSHILKMTKDIKRAFRAFENQITADKRVSDIRRFLPSLLTAFKRSLGVMLDASVRIRFGQVVESFKAIYMQAVDISPLKSYGDPFEFVEVWSAVHSELLKMLNLKDTFHIRAPSACDINPHARGHPIRSPLSSPVLEPQCASQ